MDEKKDMNEVYDALRKADAAGDTEGAKKLTEYISSRKTTSPEVKQAPKEKAGFVQRFGETFHPVKAITEEGIIPQAAQYAYRKATGTPAPKENEPAEKPVSVGKTISNVYNFAKKDPGAFAGTLANAIVADPELLLMPELLPERVLSGIEKVTKTGAALAKTADAATQAAAMAGAQSITRQLNERGKVDMNVVKNDVKNAAVIGGGTRALGETARAALPGEKYLTGAQRELVDKARAKGYTVPAGELSPVGKVIDKYYKSPVRSINKAKFYKEVTAPTGTEVSEINTRTLPKIESNLDSEIKNIVANHVVRVPEEAATELEQFLPYQKGQIQDAINSIKSGEPITGKQWHDIRSQLGMRKAAATQSNPLMAQDIGNIISGWDNFAGQQLPEKFKVDFDKWKAKYTAYKDIDNAVLGNESNYNKYLKGEFDPSDLMTSIRQRRPSEAQEPFGATARPQTQAAALGTGLDLLGEKQAAPWTWYSTVPKAVLGTVAKPMQTLAYTPLGQTALYKGIPQMGIAPYAGTFTQDIERKGK